MQIKISPDALLAIEDISSYSYKISANYANKIIKQIYSSINLLSDFPYLGR